MYRIIYSFLFIFCWLSAYSQEPVAPVLKVVSIDTVFPQHLSLIWNYDDRIDSVTVYKCYQSCNDENFYNAVDKIVMNETLVQWIDSYADLLHTNYYCVGWLYSGKSPRQCNMFLKTNLPSSGCRNEVSLSWNPYINMTDELEEYKILYRIKDDPFSYFTPLASLKGTHITEVNSSNIIRYDARYLKNATTYEFVVQAVNKTKTLFSYSNIVEFKTGHETSDPVFLKIKGVSVLDPKSITVDVVSGFFQVPFHKLYLYKNNSPLPNGNEIVVDSLDHVSSNQYLFTDKKANPGKEINYYYYAIATNNCKPSDTSNVITNICLNGDRVQNERYKDSIFFVQRGWSSLDTFELLRVVENKKFVIRDFLTIENSRCLVDIEAYMGEGSKVYYQIRSKNNYFSNIISIDHEPTIEFPNAFYPLGKIKENQTFYPILKFASEENYLFIIYNRWGQEVFRATKPPHYCFSDPIIVGEPLRVDERCLERNIDEYRSWDGTFQGKPAPAGFYAYKISYSFNEKSGRFSTSGSFMLVR